MIIFLIILAVLFWIMLKPYPMPPIKRTMVLNMAAVGAVDFLIYLRNEKQVVTLTNGSAGETFKLTFQGQLTAALAYNISAADLKTALAALSNLTTDDLTVTGSAEGPYTITFGGQWAGQNVDIMTSSAETGDLSVAITNTTPLNILLGGQRGGTLSTTADKADATTKDSNNWEENVSIIRHWTVSGDVVIVDESEAAYNGLIEAHDNNKQVHVQVVTPGGLTFSGTGNLDSLDMDGPHDGVYSASLAISGNGALVKA